MASDDQRVLCFVFTDVEGSTRYWADRPDSMASATARLDELVGATMDGHGGVVVKDRGEGDSHFVVFRSPTRAVQACADLVAAVDAEGWPDDLGLRVRAGIHVGIATHRDADYYGVAVNQTTRIRDLGHGGQVLASRAVVEMTEHLLEDGLCFRSRGTHRVRDFDRRQEIFQLDGAELSATLPRLNTADLDAAPLAAISVIDIVGAGELVGASDETLFRAVEHWQKILSTEFDERGGAALRSTGDTCVATFRDPRAAVEFVRGVRQRLAADGARIRSGIHYGPIDVVGDDITGRSVFLTHALARLATPGQILVSPAARDLLNAVGFPTTDAGTRVIERYGLTWDAHEA